MTMKGLQAPLDERVRARLDEGHDGGAATLVLQELGPEVFGFLVAALRSESDADEVFASTSERIWRSIRGFRWHCSLRTWVYVIARNELARYTEGARRDQKKRATPTELEGVVAAVRTET